MPLVPAKCTQCGAYLEVDTAKEAAICQFCKTPFVTEKAINNYNTTYIDNVGTLHADVVNISNNSERDKLAKAGDIFIELGDYAKAEEHFLTLSNEFPDDPRGWWGLVKAKSRNLTRLKVSKGEIAELDRYYNRAQVVATKEEKSCMAYKYTTYIQSANRTLESTKKQLTDELKQLDSKINQQKNDFIRTKKLLETQIDELKKEGNGSSNFGCLIISLPIIIALIISISLGNQSGIHYGIAALIVFGTISFGISMLIAVLGDFLEKKAKEERKEQLNTLSYRLNKLNEEYNASSQKLYSTKSYVELKLSNLTK